MWVKLVVSGKTADQTNRYSQAGMVSILVTMIMIVVISLIVLGFAQVSRNNQRAALDKQLSTQAFYAAESGINDAKSYIRANPLTPTTTTCGEFITTAALTAKSKLSGTGDVAYTCLTVNNNPRTLRYSSVQNNRVIATPLFSPVSIPELTFSWQANEVGSTNSADCSTGNNLPTATGGATPWNCAYGLLRLDLMPVTGATGATNLANQTKTIFFKPSNGGSGQTTITSFTTAGSRGTLVSVACNAGTSTCRGTVTLSGAASTTRYYARISAGYRSLQNVVISSSNPLVNFTGSQAIVDSTGKAQDVLRRLQVRVPLVSGSSQTDGAVVTTGSVCKLLSVIVPYSRSECPGTPVGSLPSTTCTPNSNDVVFALDNSQSMTSQWQTGTRRAKLVAVAKDFINNTNVGAVNHEAIIGFAGQAVVFSGLTGNSTQLLNAVDNVVTQNIYATHYVPALQAAQNVWAGAASRPGVTKVLIFVSDGVANDFGENTPATTTAVTNKVNELKFAGVKIYTVGINLAGPQLNLLQSMAANGGTFASASVESDLATIVGNIATDFTCSTTP